MFIIKFAFAFVCEVIWFEFEFEFEFVYYYQTTTLWYDWRIFKFRIFMEFNRKYTSFRQNNTYGWEVHNVSICFTQITCPYARWNKEKRFSAMPIDSNKNMISWNSILGHQFCHRIAVLKDLIQEFLEIDTILEGPL